MSNSPRRATRPLFLAFALAVACAVTSAGCDRGTYLEVKFREPTPRLGDVFGLRMALTLTPPTGGAPLHANDVVRNGGKAIKFPASLSFDLDEDEGLLKIDATALGVADVPVAQGSSTTTIMRDKTWSVTIDLTAL